MSIKTKKRSGWLLGLLFWLLLSVNALAATPLADHGKLSVQGTQIVDAKGKAFQLRGVSTHGLAWYPEYVSKAAFEDLRDKWGANTVRLALYTAEYHGYCQGDSANQSSLKKKIQEGVQAATDLGMYVMIDWHILSDGNPHTYKNQAIAFFKEMASKYQKYDNVLYEICNEPNGGVDWQQIKAYAQEVITAIRQYDQDAIIVVGTPNWSQDVDVAADAPLKQNNLVYALHFYAGSHKDSYRAKAQSALKKGLPLLVSEFGICDASGNGNLDEAQGNQWLTFLNQHSIGYVAWNLSNKQESSALLKSSCSKKSGWAWSDLSQSGQWLVKAMNGSLAAKAASQPAKNKTPAKKMVKASAKYCKASVKKVHSWKSGKWYYTQYKVTIANKSKKTISFWKLRIKFKSKMKKSQQWNGKFSYKSKYITVSPVSWNKQIAPKKKQKDIGFIIRSKSKKNKVTSVKFL